MARPKSNNVQINISIPSEWKTQLENLARIKKQWRMRNIAKNCLKHSVFKIFDNHMLRKNSRRIFGVCRFFILK